MHFAVHFYCTLNLFPGNNLKCSFVCLSGKGLVENRNPEYKAWSLDLLVLVLTCGVSVEPVVRGSSIGRGQRYCLMGGSRGAGPRGALLHQVSSGAQGAGV